MNGLILTELTSGVVLDPQLEMLDLNRALDLPPGGAWYDSALPKDWLGPTDIATTTLTTGIGRLLPLPGGNTGLIQIDESNLFLLAKTAREPVWGCSHSATAAE